MKVSIVLPTYNQVDMLPKAIESIMNQTYQDWELIVVNDGSTDGTKKYLESLKVPSTSEKFKIIHHDNNQKLPSALNTGFEFATGEYYTWVSSDSVCTPYMVEALVKALDTYPDSGLAHADFFIIDDNDQILTRISNPDYCFRSMVIRNDGNAAFMYPAKVAKDIGEYDTDINGAEDWDYWLRISEKYPFVYVPESLYYYRVHEKSMQQTLRKEVDESIIKMYDKLFERHNKQFQFEKLFPYVDMNSEQAFFAILNFGSELLTARISQPVNAITFLNSALQKAPDTLAAWLNLGIAYTYIGEWNEAMSCIREIRNRAGSGPILDYVNQLESACNKQDVQKVSEIPVISYHDKQQEIIIEELQHKRHVSFTLN